MAQHRQVSDYAIGPEPDAESRTVMLMGSGGEVVALPAESGDALFAPVPDDGLAPFNAPIVWYVGRDLRRLSLETTERYISIVERRLESNRALLAVLPAAVAAQKTTVDEYNAVVERARQRTREVVWADRAWERQQSSFFQSGTDYLFVQTLEFVGADRWLPSQQRYLRETTEWRRQELAEGRLRDNASPQAVAVQELTRLEAELRSERKMTSELESRLWALRQHANWWQAELAALAEG